MKLVLDASMALAWVFKREREAEADCASRALDAMAGAITLVPHLWHLEVANALLLGERRRLITEAQTLDFLTRLKALPISASSATLGVECDSVMVLARLYQLTAYDACYLDLALREGAVLATFDVQLANAMQQAQGQVFV